MYNILKKFFNKEANRIEGFKVCSDAQEVSEQMGKNGYAVIQLLDAEKQQLFFEESMHFLSEVKEQHHEINFLSIGRSENPAIRIKSNSIIRKYLEKPLQFFFNPLEYDVFYGVHLLKSNNKKSILNPHQDSSHVDETLFSSYHLWMPVTPPSPHFGTLELIPNSHKLNIPYRSLNIPWSLSKHEKKLWKYMYQIHLEKGQAVVFNSRMIHASGINNTSEMRLAANSLIIPKAADFLHFYTDKKSNYSEIEVYKITPDFYYKEDILKRPQNYPMLKKVMNVNSSYSLKELDAIFTQNNLR